MSLWLPQFQASRSQLNSTGVTITANAAAHTKGAWTELVASAPFDVSALMFYATASNHSSNVITSQFMDIAVGAAGSEQVLIGNILSGYSTLVSTPAIFPLFIPQGSRIAERNQSAGGGGTVSLALAMYGAPPWEPAGFQAVDTMGVTEATTTSTDISASGTIIEVVASTPNAYKALGVCYDLAGGTAGGASGVATFYVGAAGSEQQVFQQRAVTGGGDNFSFAAPNQGVFPLNLDIPAGTRLSAAYTSGLDLGVAFYGFR